MCAFFAKISLREPLFIAPKAPCNAKNLHP